MSRTLSQFPNKPVLEWKNNLPLSGGQFILYIKAGKLVSKGCVHYVVLVKGPSVGIPLTHSSPVVNVFPEVFTYDLL